MSSTIEAEIINFLDQLRVVENFFGNVMENWLDLTGPLIMWVY